MSTGDPPDPGPDQTSSLRIARQSREDMIELPLTKGYRALIDDQDAHLAAFKWTADVRERLVYARRVKRQPDGKDRKIYLHEAVMGRKWVDHRNGDGLDCRRSNLRPCTPLQNIGNQRRSRRNSSGYKGVSYNKLRGYWHAYIARHRKQIHLGVFVSPEEAARAYDAAAIRMFGEFAKVNFPQQGQQAA